MKNKHYNPIVACVVVFVIFAGSLLAGESSTSRNYYIYVTAESQDQVDIVRFDGSKAEVIERIPVGVWPVETEGPHGITVDPDGQYWYLSMAHGMPYGHVYKYSTETNEVLGRVELGFFPATMEISTATGFLYVVNFNLHGDHVPSTVSVVDPESMTEIERIETGVMPHGSRLAPDGLHHYSVAMMSGELFEIDALSLEVSRKLYVGKEDGMANHGGGGTHDHSGHMHHSMGHDDSPMPKPTWVYPHPSKPLAYIANNGVDEVVEVDLEKWKVVRRFSTPPGPYNVEVSPDGKKMAVTYKTDASTGIWDLKEGTEKSRIKNTRKVSHGVVFSSDNQFAFVSVEGVRGEPGALDVIDVEAGKLATSVDVGKQAGGIAFWKIAEE